MKKRKISMLLNIAVLCLCVCAIAIGVYSAKNASLNVTGTIGFTAHNCDVDISGYIYGHSITKDGTPIAKPTNNSEKVYLKNGTTDVTETSPLKITGNNGALTFGDVFFSDMGETGDLEQVRIVLTITNQSSYEVLVDADVTVPESAKCDFVCDNALQVLYTTNEGTKSKTATLTFILFPKITNGKYTEIPTVENVSLSVKFSKLNTQISSQGFTFDDATNPTKIYGVPASDDTSDVLVIPSTFTDLPGKTITTIASSSVNPTTAIDTTSFTKLVILDGIKEVGDFSFYKYGSVGGKLEKVSLPNSLEKLGAGSFSQQTNLVSCGIQNIKNESVSNIFSETKIRYVKVPITVKVIYGFCGSSLIMAEIEEGVENLHWAAFNGSLIPSLIIPNSVTNIDDRAFSNCKNLTKITIPNSITHFGGSIFDKSTNLHTIIFKGTKTEWNAIDKTKSPSSNTTWYEGSSDFTIYCTDGEITKAEAIQ
ncbi:MAG: leucine-rich repeat domain-containing protein [Eubacteriales bacterium]|nr:leucine-rich repeat domain-containing protein [Eubacteriales bacterium]